MEPKRKLTEKELIELFKSLVNSGDLKLKVNITENDYETIASSVLSYKSRKILNVKYSKFKDV